MKIPYEVVRGYSADIRDPSIGMSDSERHSSALLAVDWRTAIEFRDEDNGLFHLYELPATIGISHYFRYLLHDFEALDSRQIKFRFILNTLFIIRKIALHRKTASILEIGGTVGENYQLLQNFLKSEPYEFLLKFMIIDKDLNNVAVAQEVFENDENFYAMGAEASILDGIPDDSFDLVTSNGVHNILDDPLKGISEALRVSRVAVNLQLIVSLDEPVTYRSGGNDITYQALTLDQVREAASIHSPVFMYRINKYWVNKINQGSDDFSDGKYLDPIVGKSIHWETIILAHAPIFPEIDMLFELVN